MSRTIAEKVTIIGHHKCSDCGTLQPVKVNKNGRGYYFCHGPSPDGDPRGCRVEHKLSPYLSSKMIATYRNGDDADNANAPPSSTAANTNAKPKSAGGSLFD